MEEGFLCEWYSCPVPCSCCFPDGTCEVLNEAECLELGGTPEEEGGSCDPNPCVVTSVPEEGYLMGTWGQLRMMYR
jgi:hypothetical protein